MKFEICGIKFSAHFLVVSLMALCIISDTSLAVCVCFLSAVFHECGHLLAMLLCRIKPRSITLRAFDIVIDAQINKSFWADVFITLSGPFLNFIFALIFMDISKRIFYSNLVIGIFNLLPVKSFDGGHALYVFLARFMSEKCADIILKVITFIFLLVFFVFSILLLFECKYNYSLLLISLYLTAILFIK